MIRVPCTSGPSISIAIKSEVLCARGVMRYLVAVTYGAFMCFASTFRGREGKFMIALSFVFFIFLESDYAACQLNDNRNCDGWKALKSSSSAINLSQKILTIRRVLGLTIGRALFRGPQLSGVIRFTATDRVTLTERIALLINFLQDA